MSESREQILAALRTHHPPDAPLPPLADGPWITYPDPAAQFENVLCSVGGNCERAATIDQIRRALEQLPAYASAAKVYSLVPGIENRNVDPPSITDPHQLEDIEFAILPGRFAVAENAAVWVTDEGLPHRVIYFIAQHVALVVPATTILHNMHQAYEQLRFERPGFGCFVSGPSKTADIEQSLVIGAHGARSLTVFLLDRNP
jgi:L-lactate dehydrogenase complex protein LldG